MSGLLSKVTAFFLALGWCLLVWQNAAQVVADEGESKPQVVYLHTEFMPHQKIIKDRTTRLGRELARQAFIMACEEELGVAVRDASLDETIPSEEEVEVVHLAFLVRNTTSGGKKLLLKLYELSPEQLAKGTESAAEGLWDTEPLWGNKYRCRMKTHLIYVAGASVLEQLARNDFVDILKQAGVRLAKNKTTTLRAEDEQETSELSSHLMEVDFVKVFGALRKIHGRVTESNQTATRHGLLARGYAQLNALTRHHYSSSEEVFAARAMLFAERMVVEADTLEATVEALWHRAYVLSMVGLDKLAWSDLEQIRKIEKDDIVADEETSDDSDSNSASESVVEDQSEEFSESEQWKLLVEPFTKWDQQALIEVGDRYDQLRPWSRRLAFMVIDGNRYPELVLEAATEFGHGIPADYGMYAEMVKYGGLAIARTGARLGPMAFRQRLPTSLDSLDDLPEDIKEFLPVDRERRKFAQEVIPDLDLDGRFSPIGSHVATELHQKSRCDDSNALSWSVLGSLIREEQFALASCVLRTATNATESSLADLVDQVLPFVNEHRYAGYIQSFRYHPASQTDQCWEHLKNLKVRDPSGKMYRMISRYGACADRVDPELRKALWRSANTKRNFTTIDFLRRLFPNSPACSERDKEYYMALGNLLRTFTKFSEAGWRVCICNGVDPDQEQLKSWEENIKNDSMAFYYLGRQYQTKDLDADAERCFKKSVDILPTVKNVRALAAHYFEQKNYEDWELTYLDYLETQPIGLKGANVHDYLAKGFATRDMYRKALPHARKAAETYSAWGLKTAATLTEKMARWEESERWVQALSKGYPSNSGASWYYWCRRTGRGDLAAARRFLARLEAVSSKKHRSRTQWIKTGVFRLMEDDVEGALEAYQKALSYYMSITCTVMVSQLSRQLNDDASSRIALENYLKVKVDSEDNRDLDECSIVFVRMIQSGQFDDQKLAEIEEMIVKLRPVDISLLSYFVGKELLIRGDNDKAKVWLQRSMRTRGQEENYFSLAGMELAGLNGGTSRRDNEVLSRKDLWPPEEETSDAKQGLK